MAEKIQHIPARLKNMAVGGHVAGAEDIDAGNGKTQQEINADTYRKSETYSKEQLDNMITTPEQEYKSVVATSSTATLADIAALIATKYPDDKEKADTIYRVGNWDGTQYNTGAYSEYTWDGEQYVFISKKEPGIDDEPIPGSGNLVKSGGVYNRIILPLGLDSQIIGLSKNTGYVTWDDGTISGNATFFHTDPISLSAGDIIVAMVSANNQFAVVASVDNGVYTPLIQGKGSMGVLDKYLYIADQNISIVISGYSSVYDKSCIVKVSTDDGLLHVLDEKVLGNQSEINKLYRQIGYKNYPIVIAGDGYVTWDDGTISGNATFFHTDPIHLSAGDKLSAKLYAAGSMCAISKYELINGVIQYTPLVKGQGASKLIDYTYTASEDIDVVISSYTAKIGEIVLTAVYNGGIQDSIAELDTNVTDLITAVDKLGIPTISKSQNKGYIQFSDGELVSTTSSLFFHTDPISLSAGDKIIVNTYAAGVMAAIASVEEISGSQVFTPLAQGKGASLLSEYTYTADNDTQVVVCGYTAHFDEVSISVIKSNGVIGDLSRRIDEINPATINLLSAFENVICVGDSLTYCAVYDGKNHNNPFYPDPQRPQDTDVVQWRQAYHPWPIQIAAMSGIDNSAIYAVPGYNPTQVWTRFSTQFEVPDKKTLCIIYLGTNGGLTDTLDTDAPAADVESYETAWANTYTGSYCKIIQKFINLGCKILLVVPHTMGGTTSDIETTRITVVHAAERFNCAYIDDALIYLSPSDAPQYHYYSDLSGFNTLHYNDLGYAYFGGGIIKQVGLLPADNIKFILP